jgi:putative ATP-binding cassette transporter
MMIQRRWRSWLTTSVIGRWLANGRYYQLNLIGGDHSNPEARIAEDLRIATEAPVDFVAGVIAAFLSASTFIMVLWTIGGALTLTVAGSTITIPGFLVVTDGDLRRVNLQFDGPHRPQLCSGLRGKEPGGG